MPSRCVARLKESKRRCLENPNSHFLCVAMRADVAGPVEEIQEAESPGEAPQQLAAADAGRWRKGTIRFIYYFLFIFICQPITIAGA